jgi:hypothetical protein
MPVDDSAHAFPRPFDNRIASRRAKVPIAVLENPLLQVTIDRT